jgi:Zn-finger protein
MEDLTTPYPRIFSDEQSRSLGDSSWYYFSFTYNEECELLLCPLYQFQDAETGSYHSCGTGGAASCLIFR